MHKFVLIWIVLLASVASADSSNTYQFMFNKNGLVTQHPERAAPRCVSPNAERRVREIAQLDPKFTIGHGQVTMTWIKDGKSHSWAADDAVEHSHGMTTGIWHVPPAEGVGQIDIHITIDPHKPVTPDGSTVVPEMTIDSIQTNNGVSCYEEWQAEGVKL
jgi:hypothetical protein